jgi:flagellar operon protein
MKIQDNSFLSIGQAAGQYPRQTDRAGIREDAPGLSFQDILGHKTQNAQSPVGNDLKFSKHAAGRLTDRNIALTDSQVERLSDGTRKAGLKGIKDSLVIVDQLAFIVNVPNNTVITALDRSEAAENIFTNIDGAIIM